jgi:phospholipid/cholesterol/gamma-HCH transport system ATP-binding protein
MIEVRNIDKHFGEKQVLKNISAVFERGRTNLIIGASGSGKTTLVKCIVGLHEVDKGEVLYDGERFSAMTKKERKKIRKDIGFLFQASALFDSMTVEENVMFPLQMFSNMTRKEMKLRADSCLERVNLKNVNHLFPSELSGGMKKRVGIARAISVKPKYLFCDEPNSGLDPQTSIIIDNLISDITRELDITTIVITHDMNSVMEIGDSVTFIYKGEKWWEGSKKDILESDNQELVDFVYASDFMKEIRATRKKM